MPVIPMDPSSCWPCWSFSWQIFFPPYWCLFTLDGSSHKLTLPWLKVLLTPCDLFFLCTAYHNNWYRTMNGPAFISHDFIVFVDKNGIRQSLTSPYHPLLKWVSWMCSTDLLNYYKKLDGLLETRLSHFLLKYRSPLSPLQVSLPQNCWWVEDNEQLWSSSPRYTKENWTETRKSQQPRQKIHTFSIRDKLYAKNFSGSSAWFPFTVIKITGPVSYLVETESGIVIHRYVDQLRSRYTDSKKLQMKKKIRTIWWFSHHKTFPKLYTYSYIIITCQYSYYTVVMSLE